MTRPTWVVRCGKEKLNSEQWSHLGGGLAEQVTGLSEGVVLGDNVT